MSTTTIRLEDELKSRVAAAAERSGQTSHAFILDAIAGKVEQVELDEALHRVAATRWAALQATGRSIAWDDAKAYLQRRARGESARKPRPRKPPR